MEQCLISVIVPSRRPNELLQLITTIDHNTFDKSQIELIIKIDEDQPEFTASIQEIITNYDFTIKLLTSPRLYGYFTMWANNHLCFTHLDNDAYFVLLLTDEARFEKDWDKSLRKYHGFYNDHIFRLKLSHAKYLNYYNIGQVNYLPDSFSVLTRKWLELTNGYGDCWGSDVFTQSISYHLGRGIGSFASPFIKEPISRDIPVNERVLSNLEIFGDSSNELTLLCKNLIMYDEWIRTLSYKTQRMHCYYARLIYLNIIAHQLQLEHFEIRQNIFTKQLLLTDTQLNQEIIKVSYNVPRLYGSIPQLGFKYFKYRVQIKLFYPLLLRILKLFSLNTLLKPFASLAKGCKKIVLNKINQFIEILYHPLVQKALFPICFFFKPRISSNLLQPREIVIYNSSQPGKIQSKEPILALDSGSLFKVKNKSLIPSKFFKKIIAKCNYTSCSDEEFEQHINKIFSNGYKTDI
ncbi:hypothetical protein [Rickettsiales endosymbiont of Stachyamoeba lipophora]|uniref:hypothetical protein n=1 Tax=Rickettsiales endosymbiont of Stachyamoeba lipophora TaxID=2486578 RepID=UPI000F65372E|nr:hypothetical protein [Rickettsiales endosymbiont of Stachyamoeba lipophora]AZL15698.1 hypothetical protein EF513_03930 [Rickettsiales endosymbiont of Stachyamoeba lipophora]